MNPLTNNPLSPDDVFRTMREMIAEASSEEVHDLAREADIDVKKLAQTGRNTVEQALHECNQGERPVILHKGLSSLLVMLRRRDGFDEEELARKAQVDEEEIRRIEFDANYMP